jgi:4-oxalocrotonate tautomerase
LFHTEEEAMPFVNIRLVREVIASDPEAKKAAIAKKVTAAITEATGLSNDDVWVVFEEVAARDWYVGATNVETRRKAK